jgi:apolipoprotein N-acyltransferase
MIFSETSLRRPYLENEEYYATNPRETPLLPFIRESGAWLLTGAPYVLDWKDFKVMNAAILIDPQGRLSDFYGKSHPVPFTEAIPLMEFAWFRAFMKNVVGLDGGWTTGTRLTVFELPLRDGASLHFGVPICFEDAFPGLCGDFVRRGADILINITNDSWSQTRSAEIQHWAAARFRAIETRRTLVRSTNGGLSCVIAPTGVNVFELPLFSADAKVVDIPVYSGKELTIYTRYGDWFVLICLLLLSFSIILPYTRTSRRNS